MKDNKYVMKQTMICLFFFILLLLPPSSERQLLPHSIFTGQ